MGACSVEFFHLFRLLGNTWPLFYLEVLCGKNSDARILLGNVHQSSDECRFFKKKKDPNINLKRVNVCSLVLEQ